MTEYVDFITLHEDFSEYEVENGQILRAKQILTDIKTEEIDAGKKMSGLGIKDVSSVITPKPIDTTNLEYSPLASVTEKDEVKELTFKPKKEVINI